MGASYLKNMSKKAREIIDELHKDSKLYHEVHGYLVTEFMSAAIVSAHEHDIYDKKLIDNIIVRTMYKTLSDFGAEHAPKEWELAGDLTEKVLKELEEEGYNLDPETPEEKKALSEEILRRGKKYAKVMAKKEDKKDD